MSDAHLRQLSHAAKAGDPVAGWNYIREVERQGRVVVERQGRVVDVATPSIANEKVFQYAYNSPAGTFPTKAWKSSTVIIRRLKKLSI